MKSKLITLAVGLWIGGFYASDAIAVPINWITPTGGDFDDPNNWLGGIVPGVMDDPIFDLPDTYTVTFMTDPNTGPLSVTDGDVTFSLGGISYSVAGNVDIGGSLAVNSGTLDAGVDINIFSGGALKGDGTLLLSDPVGGGSVLNSGTVAPGNGAGIITIDGNYQQSAVGALEIEVGGLAAGSEHDQLFLPNPTSSAMLAGRLNVPFINSYTPMVTHNIPFLLGGNSGSFDIISLPDYQNDPNTPVAVQVVYPMESASLSFVTPTAVSSAIISVPSFWGEPSTWSGDVPITSDVVTMDSIAPFPTRVDLDPNTPASQRAFAHEVNISSMSPTAPFTLGIPSETSLSAISRVAVGENGIVEMSGGAVFTNLVQVAGGGKVLGNGTIAGDVVLGVDMGIGEATLSPGISGSAAGVFNIENLTINSNGVLAVAVVDPNNFGQVIVEGNASLGGRLVIDATNVTALIGTRFDVVVAGTFEQAFDSIETVGGNGEVFFAPVVPTPLISPGLEALITCEGNGAIELHSTGDMNLDGNVDADDADDFVEGLLDPSLYWSNHCFMFPVNAGDFSADFTFDFDDIEGFTQEVEGLVAADIFALIEQMSVPEPTSCGLLLLGSGLLGATGSRRLKRSVRRSD